MTRDRALPQVTQVIEVRAVSDMVSERILELISSHTLRPGDPLPPQRELASQLGVSLSSLREALHTLAAIGVIEVKRGLGTFVCNHSSDYLVKRFDWALLLQEDETRELMEARRVIDLSVASYAAQRATPEQIAGMVTLFEGIMESWETRDLNRLEELDIRFHLAIAEAAGNSLLCLLAESLYAVVDGFIRVVPHTKAGMENHRRVLEAIVEQEPAKAEAAMRVLLDQTEQLYQKHKHT
ncbi:MAG: FadR family transcriptional regulator [Anaerolineae bacterium]|nr:FadR family transcriptional regulator [Anaerolineae bacterium]